MQAMAITIFSDVFNSITQTVSDLTSNNIANVMGVLEPLLVSAFTVYLLFIFLSYWNGRAEENIVDFLKRCIAWCLILTFSLNIGAYNNYIMPIVLNFGDGLSQAFSGQGNSVQSSLDTIIDTVITGMENGWNEISGLDIAGQLLFFIALLIMLPPLIIFLTMSMAYLMLAKVFCAVLAVIGPLYIMCALFPNTRQFFFNWVNQIVTYSVMVLILNVFVGLFVGFMIEEIRDMSTIIIPTAINVAVMSIIFFVLLMRVPDLASALGNGMSISGFSQGARSIANLATGGKASLAMGKKAFGKAVGSNSMKGKT